MFLRSNHAPMYSTASNNILYQSNTLLTDQADKIDDSNIEVFV